MTTWNKIIEASLTELFIFEREFMSQDETRLNQVQVNQLFYIRTLIAYYRQDSGAISRYLENQSLLLKESILLISKMRLVIRTNEFNLSDCNFFLTEIQKLDCDEILKAEAEFAIATCYLMKSEFVQAESLFKTASVCFERACSIKKSLRSSLSALAAYSCAQPNSRLFYEYTELFNRCVEAGEYLSAGTALINISREFQILGARDVAVNYSDRAMVFFEKQDRGSREHGLSLAHLSQLHFELGNKIKAESVLLLALSVGNKDVQSACHILSEKYQINYKVLPSEVSIPTWTERVEEDNKNVLSPLESQLIQLLSQSPKDKFELMDLLYGELIDVESKEGRLKNILFRLRSRYPNLIKLKDQKYYLAEVERSVG